MTTHNVRATHGDEFQLEIDDEGRITKVAGPVPEEDGAEFEFQGPLPAHAEVYSPPHIKEFAANRGRTVCYYDDVACLTCYCDDEGNMSCRRMC